MYRKIIHIDMDAFFASVEQLDNPELRGRPVIVGGSPDSRGVVAACSYEARKFGIHSAMPSAKAAKLCPHAVFTTPRKYRYKEVSEQIMGIFSHYTEIVEQLSVDEAFLDVTINHLQKQSASELAAIILGRIKKEIHLTASAGVSYNKFLAKMASGINKPKGLTVIPPEQAISFINNLPIGMFYGVGKVTEKKMQRIGIRYGKDLRQFTREDLIFHFGKSGAFFHDIARGIDKRAVTPKREIKSIGSETTLSVDMKDFSEIYAILNKIADKIANILTNKSYSASTVTLKVRYHDFITITRSITGAIPLTTAKQIIEHIDQLIPNTEIGKKRVRLLGITLSKLQPENRRKPIQLRLPFIHK